MEAALYRKVPEWSDAEPSGGVGNAVWGHFPALAGECRARRRGPGHDPSDFATGARKCIGDSFAMAEATLATITARWRLKHLPGHHRTRPVLGASIGPGELRMQPTAR